MRSSTASPVVVVTEPLSVFTLMRDSCRCCNRATPLLEVLRCNCEGITICRSAFLITLLAVTVTPLSVWLSGAIAMVPSSNFPGTLRHSMCWGVYPIKEIVIT